MKMLSAQEIDTIATTAAQANLTREVAQRVFSAPITDSDGHEALLLTVVIAPDGIEKIAGTALLDNLLDTQRKLQSAGEERHAIISYATEDELADGRNQS